MSHESGFLFFSTLNGSNHRNILFAFFQENVVIADAVQSVEETKEAEPEINWKVKDFCRSIYSEDGEEYEGVINISK